MDNRERSIRVLEWVREAVQKAEGQPADLQHSILSDTPSPHSVGCSDRITTL
jgi:hypothetical protein